MLVEFKVTKLYSVMIVNEVAMNTLPEVSVYPLKYDKVELELSQQPYRLQYLH